MDSKNEKKKQTKQNKNRLIETGDKLVVARGEGHRGKDKIGEVD